MPRWPVYIPTKGRSDIALTPGLLDRLKVPYTLIVEEPEHDAYRAAFPHARLLILDPAFQDAYDPMDGRGRELPLGSGPARNLAWEDSIQQGADWHWIVDDNIQFFDRFHENRKVRFGDGSIFWLMEEFTMRWRNVSMAGPNYHMFVIPRSKRPPFQVGTRIYSCNLIRNAVPLRWRGRYNEDTDLSLRMLKAGWQTILFNAYLQFKTRTQVMRGGNTDTVYVDGTLEKSRLIARLHPDVARVTWKFGRWHHDVDYSQWRDRPLLPDPDYQPNSIPQLAASPRSSRYTETHQQSERWGW